MSLSSDTMAKLSKTAVFFFLSLYFCILPINAATLVYLLAGQSNMLGHETGLPPAPYHEAQKVKYWSGADKGWIDLQPGLGETDNDIGPEVGFGFAMKAKHPNDDIYLVKWAIGSTALAGPWEPGIGSEYQTFKKRVDAALESLSSQAPKIGGMIWMQGESDALDTAKATAYATNLKNLIETVRSDFSSPNMPFVVGRITDLSIYSDFPRVAVDAIRDAQESAPEVVGHAAWIDTDDLSMSSEAPGHYDEEGQIELGQRFAEKIQGLNGEAEKK